MTLGDPPLVPFRGVEQVFSTAPVAASLDRLSASFQQLGQFLDERALQQEAGLITSYSVRATSTLHRIFGETPDIDQATRRAEEAIATFVQEYPGTVLGKRALEADLFSAMRNAEARATAQNLARERQVASADETLRLEQLKAEALAAADSSDKEGFALANLRLRVLSETAQHLTPAQVQAALIDLGTEWDASQLARSAIERVRKEGVSAYLEEIERIRTADDIAPQVRSRAISRITSAGSAILQRQQHEKEKVLSDVRRDLAFAVAAGRDPMEAISAHAGRLDDADLDEMVTRHLPSFVTWVTGRAIGIVQSGAMDKLQPLLSDGKLAEAAKLLRESGENDLAARLEDKRFGQITLRILAREIAEVVQERAERLQKFQIEALARAGAIPPAQAEALVAAGMLTPSEAISAAKAASDPARAVVQAALLGMNVGNAADSLAPSDLDRAAEKIVEASALIGDEQNIDLLEDTPEARTKRARITRKTGLLFQKDIRWLKRVLRVGDPNEVGEAQEFLQAIGISGESASPRLRGESASTRLSVMSRGALGRDELDVLDEIGRRSGYIDERTLDLVRSQIFETSPSATRRAKKASEIFMDPDMQEKIRDEILANLPLWERAAPNLLGGAPDIPPEMVEAAIPIAEAFYAQHGDPNRAAREAAKQVLRDWTHDGDSWKFRPPELLYPVPKDPVTGEPIEGVPTDWWKPHLVKSIARAFKDSLMSEEEVAAWDSAIRSLETPFVGVPFRGLFETPIAALLGDKLTPTSPEIVQRLLDAGVFRLVPVPGMINENNPPGYWIEYDDPRGGTQFLMLGDGRFEWKPTWDTEMRMIYQRAAGEAAADAAATTSLVPDVLRDLFGANNLEHYWNLVRDEVLEEIFAPRSAPEARKEEPPVPTSRPESRKRQIEEVILSPDFWGTKGASMLSQPDTDPLRARRTTGVSQPPDFAHEIDDPELQPVFEHIRIVEGGLREERPGDQRTNWGVQQGTLDAARQIWPQLPAKVDDLTWEQAKLIYARLFLGHRNDRGQLIFSWKAVKEILGDPDYATGILDALIQSGPRVLTDWQRRLAARTGIRVDSQIGPETLAAIDSVGRLEAAIMLLEERVKRARRVVKIKGREDELEGLQNRLDKAGELMGVPRHLVPRIEP